MDDKRSAFSRIFILVRSKLRIYTFIFIGVSLPLIYWFVYATGGIEYVYSHTMYIPILIAGIVLGKKWGIITAILGGILLGPFMPLETVGNIPQLPMNYIYRLIIFMLIGFLSGFASETLRKKNADLKTFFSLNQETNIPNTNNIVDYVEKMEHQEPLFLMTVLINHSESIIDVVGLHVFHRIMRTIYDSIKNKLRDNALIVQSGESKFWIIKPLVRIEEDQNEILGSLKIPLILDDVPLYVEFASGGSILYDPQKLLALESFNHSDNAAKHAQTNNLAYMFYDESILKKHENLELLGVFHDALDNGQIYLDYQPKLCLKTGKPFGLEALIRWNHPTKGNIPPIRFIPLIEETQLIHELTYWVLSNSLETIKRFNDHGLETSVSINVSAKNLMSKVFAEKIIEMVTDSGVNPNHVEIELTETALMANPEFSKAYLNKISSSGIQISIDDFGTGYSSLAYLSSFPIDILKIDKHFISNIEGNLSTRQIVKSTIDLSHHLGYKVVGEGVETEKILKELKDLECDIAQGYFIERPMDGDAILKWYKDHQ